MGMSTNAYRLFLQEQALTQEVLKRELKPQTMVKEVEVLEFYNENLTLWKTPEYAEVEHVLLAKVDLATGRRLNPMNVLPSRRRPLRCRPRPWPA